MKQITIRGELSGSDVFIAESIDNVLNYCPKDRLYIITDCNVDRLYGLRFPVARKYVVASGEQSKNMAVMLDIYRWLLDSAADRESFILGIGGGVVCDIAGFAASTFMRGVKFGFVATTLLAQVDASIGGKNGIDLDGFKNIIGTFNQPEFVICDTSMLETLPAVELSCGYAEMIKHCLLASYNDLVFMEQNHNILNSCDIGTLTPLLARSVAIKAAIVNSDVKERGARKTLNLGHTWGHAVEKVTNLPHGQCVSIGLEFAARLSLKMEMITLSNYKWLVKLLQNYNLPVSCEEEPETVFEALTKDKKKNGDSIDFILLKGLGEVVIKNIELAVLKEFALTGELKKCDFR